MGFFITVKHFTWFYPAEKLNSCVSDIYPAIKMTATDSALQDRSVEFKQR